VTATAVSDTGRAGAFSGGVVALFGTQVFGAALGVVSGILLARLLGPAAKGDYYLIVLLPATALMLLQLGLPQAFGFFSARGATRDILWKAFTLVVTLSAVAATGVAILLLGTDDGRLSQLRIDQVALAFLGFPLALHAMFTTGIVTGRKAVRWFSGITIAQAVVSLALLVGVLVGFGASVTTAIIVYLLGIAFQSVAFAYAARRVVAANPTPERVSYGQLFGYGLPFYPGSLATFFSYRVDAYLIAFLIPNPSTALGYYSVAVGLAEMVFFFPRAVSILFFPHVASSNRDEADAHVARVSRVTLLVTAVFALLLIPAAAVLIWLLLPAFKPSMAPLLVLLPGAVALSVTTVLDGYFRGIGRPGVTSTVSLISLVINVVANVVLIPTFGIVGAAAASLVSYTLTSVTLTVIARRTTAIRALDFWLPRTADVRYVASMSASIVGRVLGHRAGFRPKDG
jgi:O-antigen/teichoic acid export membrane protein